MSGLSVLVVLLTLSIAQPAQAQAPLQIVGFDYEVIDGVHHFVGNVVNFEDADDVEVRISGIIVRIEEIFPNGDFFFEVELEPYEAGPVNAQAFEGANSSSVANVTVYGY